MAFNLSTSTKQGVEFVRAELLDMAPSYELVDDCIAGEIRIKSKKELYLPVPGDTNAPDIGMRYKSYLGRAVFYNVAGRTLEGLVGRVFTREAVIEVPNILNPVLDDANGESTSLDQLAQEAVAKVLKGGAGLHVDYPKVEGGSSREDINSGRVRPTIHLYDRYNITNWRKIRVSGKDVYTLIVLREQYTVADDGFASIEDTQYRVLRLIDNVYTTELWRRPAKTAAFELFGGRTIPLNFSGQPYNEIPFRFIGPRKNNSDVEKSVLYDLCSLNIAHFRNSADYEESCYMTGQPTVWASGLSEQWVKEVLGGEVMLGARGLMPLPADGTAGILQAEPNIMPKEAMEHKERQMVALGAKLVEQKSVQRTATEASADEQAETSTLSSVARNVSKAFQWALQWCGYFVGIAENSIKFELNTDFDLADLSPEERGQLVREWQAEAITTSEMRAGLRRAGVATLDEKEYMAGIASDRANFRPEANDNDDANPGEDDSEDNSDGVA
jgi:hypothetical protein